MSLEDDAGDSATSDSAAKVPYKICMRMCLQFFERLDFIDKHLRHKLGFILVVKTKQLWPFDKIRACIYITYDGDIRRLRRIDLLVLNFFQILPQIICSQVEFADTICLTKPCNVLAIHVGKSCTYVCSSLRIEYFAESSQILSRKDVRKAVRRCLCLTHNVDGFRDELSRM